MAEKINKGGRGNSRSPDSVKDLKDTSQQGKAAEALLSNKTLDKALNEMQRNVFEWICESNEMETEKREELYRFIKTIKGFKGVLKVYFNKGATASKKLEAIINGG